MRRQRIDPIGEPLPCPTCGIHAIEYAHLKGRAEQAEAALRKLVDRLEHADRKRYTESPYATELREAKAALARLQPPKEEIPDGQEEETEGRDVRTPANVREVVSCEVCGAKVQMPHTAGGCPACLVEPPEGR